MVIVILVGNSNCDWFYKLEDIWVLCIKSFFFYVCVVVLIGEVFEVSVGILGKLVFKEEWDDGVFFFSGMKEFCF